MAEDARRSVEGGFSTLRNISFKCKVLLFNSDAFPTLNGDLAVYVGNITNML